MKPILFNTNMVLAILAGKKTVTRRVIKPQPFSVSGKVLVDKPPYQPGDILYVREAWFQHYDGTYDYRAGHKSEKEGGWRPSIHMPKDAARIFLQVTGVRVERLQDITESDAEKEGFERYGIDRNVGTCIPAIANFYALWNTTIKPADLAIYGWEANPFVWVIEFEQCEKPGGENIDQKRNP